MTLHTSPAWRALVAHTAPPLPHLRELFAADAPEFDWDDEDFDDEDFDDDEGGG